MTSGRGPQFGHFGFETIRAEGLATPPGARIADDFVNAVIDGDGTGIGFDREAASHIAVRHAVAIAIELHAEIFVHERFDCVAVIVRDDRQRVQRGGLKAIDGPLPGFAMQPLVGDFGEPLAGLAIHIVQIGELAQRPEALTEHTRWRAPLCLSPSPPPDCRPAG